MPDIPWIRGAFRHVLHPPGQAAAQDKHPGQQWYINDHCFLVAEDNRIHWFGITNPYPAEGVAYYGPGTHRHIGHASAPHPFGPWTEHPDAFVLAENDLDGFIGACFAERHGAGYIMLYNEITAKQHMLRVAGSTDLLSWKLLEDAPSLHLGEGTRDPCILRRPEGGYFLYAAAGYEGWSAVVMAESPDLQHWTPLPPALISDVRCSYSALESPFVLRHDDAYYLFLNYSHRQYEETLVFVSDSPCHFDWHHPLCTLFAHAAEFFVWNGITYMSHCGIEDRRYNDVVGASGLRLAELAWADQ